MYWMASFISFSIVKRFKSVHNSKVLSIVQLSQIGGVISISYFTKKLPTSGVASMQMELPLECYGPVV